MRSLLLSAALLASAAVVAKACSVVEVVETKPSSRKAKITVLLSGKPKASANVEVVFSGAPDPRSFVTNSEGIVLLSDLPVGTSCMTATAENNLRAALCLIVATPDSTEISSFAMSLFPGPPQAPPLAEQIRAAEREPTLEKLRRLNGTVLDPAGAFVPRVEVQIYGQGSDPQNRLAKILTNEDGKFTAPLAPGRYTVVFQRAGFKTAFRVIEISADGRDWRLQGNLEIASCT